MKQKEWQVAGGEWRPLFCTPAERILAILDRVWNKQEAGSVCFNLAPGTWLPAPALFDFSFPKLYVSYMNEQLSYSILPVPTTTTTTTSPTTMDG